MKEQLSRTSLALLAVLFATSCVSRIGTVVLYNGPAVTAAPTAAPTGSPTAIPPCTVGFKSPVIHAKRGEKIAWVIVNTCGTFDKTARFTVGLGDFALQGSAKSPLSKDSLSVTLMGPVSAEIKGRVRKDAAYGEYTYKVRLGDVVIDPRLIINE